MSIRIATFNCENLFSRPQAMADGEGASGQAAIDDQAELNAIVARSDYGDAERARLIALDQRYGFSLLSPPANALVELKKIRGSLFHRTNDGVVTVVATGRGDWTGWFELKGRDVEWTATYNTGRVIAETNADIQVVVEVESRPTLLRFNEQVLGAQFDKAYPHVMLIDGNDDRGIDVGVLSRWPIRNVVSHVDDLDAEGRRIFSRDCPEYLIDLPGGRRIVVLPNHFKSKRGGNSASVQARRQAQADAAHRIARAALQHGSYVLLAGDLNDTPDYPGFAALWQDGFVDVKDHPTYPADRPGTYDTGTAAGKFDYLIMSPKLRAALLKTGIERRGSYHPHTWVAFDSVKSKADEASDHHLVWADFAI